MPSGSSKVQIASSASIPTLLYGSYFLPVPEVHRYLRGMEPVDRANTFLIYDFTLGSPLASRE